MKIFYWLKHAQEKLAWLKNHLAFLIRCWKNYVIPKDLRVTVQVVSPQARLIARRTSLSLLREVIWETWTKKKRIEKKVSYHAETLQWTVNAEQWKPLDAWCSTATKKVFAEYKTRQILKLERLTSLPHHADSCNWLRWSSEVTHQQTLHGRIGGPGVGIEFCSHT